MLTESLHNFFDYLGAEWVLWLLLVLAAVALWVMIERALFFRRHRADPAQLAQLLEEALSSGDRQRAIAAMTRQPSMEGRVIAKGIAALERGSASVEEVIQGAMAIERVAYDRYLGFLGTLGNNAPFIGLFGTVLGIMSAFATLQGAGQTADRARAIMGSISEALVATAVGLVVAIPAVIAYNQFKTGIKERLAHADALARILLAHAKATPPSGDRS